VPERHGYQGRNKHTMDYYPGAAYVDWTGVDGYNWGMKNTVAGRLSDRFSRKSILCLQPRKNRS
jgi:beta-mannanase